MGILVSLCLGFFVYFLVFPKEKIRIFCWQEIGILFHFFLGCFWQFAFFGAKEKPVFMVTGNRDFTSFFHEFCSWFRLFCSCLLSLCAAYFLKGKKNGIYCHFSYD
jgi:hypothetical protein